MMGMPMARRLIVAIAAMLACAVPWSAAAHDIPSDVKINAFVVPAGKRLEALILSRFIAR